MDGLDGMISMDNMDSRDRIDGFDSMDGMDGIDDLSTPRTLHHSLVENIYFVVLFSSVLFCYCQFGCTSVFLLC